MPSAAKLDNLLVGLLADLQDLRFLWQVAVVAVALALAWWMSGVAARRLTQGEGAGAIWRAALRRAALPGTALILLLVGRGVMHYWSSTHLLDVAVPLVGSLLAVRIAVFVLRFAFRPGGWVSVSERAIAWVIWVGFALHVTGILPEIFTFLDGIGFPVGKQRITLLLIAQAAASIALTLLVALTIGRLIENRVMGAQALDINLRVMAVKLSRALLVLVAVLVALPAVGIDLTVLSVFGGALGVGLGFGLQKIASNYVSGFIILADKSLSIGDFVTADGKTGQVTRLSARYVVLRSPDGIEAIIRMKP